MSGFLSIDVIKQVKIRPGIYNREVLKPPRKEHRQQLFMEVAQNVTPAEEWEDFTEEDKETRIWEVINKWKNLRDHFYREVKRVEAGQSKNRRKYIYYDDMEFVRPYIGYKMPPLNKREKKSKQSLKSIEEDTDQDDTDINMEEFLKPNDKSLNEESKPAVIKNSFKRAANSRQYRVGGSTSSHSPKEDVIKNFNVLKKTDGTKIPTYKIRESDLSFCLSLVPTLRELTGTRKLSAKIDILKVLHTHLDEVERNRNDNDYNIEKVEIAEEDNYTTQDDDPLNYIGKRK